MHDYIMRSLVDAHIIDLRSAADRAQYRKAARDAESRPRMCIRQARSGEAGALSALAMRSKAHWGYDEAFLAQVSGVLTLSEFDLRHDDVYVLEANRGLAGFYRLVGEPPEGELSDLWLAPEWIGRGAGRMLFKHARQGASHLGFASFLIESDPNAEGFYLAMGATRIGERVSPAERSLPLLRISTSECSDRAVLADSAIDV